MNGHPAAGIAIMPAPGANALKLVDEVKRGPGAGAAASRRA